MNVFTKFDEIPSMLLQDIIKETKRYRHTFVHLFVRTDNMKTVYPPTNTVCGGYNNADDDVRNSPAIQVLHETYIKKIFLETLGMICN